MALHSRWTSENLEFYDGAVSVATITKSGAGLIATNYYVATTGTAGISYTATGPVVGMVVVKGLVTAVTT